MPPPPPAPDPLHTLLETQAAQRVDQELKQIYDGSGGALPPDLKDIGKLTLREIVLKWGTLPGLLAAVKASKLFAEFQLREVEAAKKRGDLIDRKVLTSVVWPLVDMAFRRLTAEAPTALREQIIARVMSGGDDLALDVERLIHDENAGILKDCQASLRKQIEAMD